MLYLGPNYTAIIVAAVAAFLFGGAYYAVLSKAWIAALGKPEEEIRRTGMAIPLLVTAVSLLVMAWVLSGVIGHIAPGRSTVRGGLITGGFCWLGFVATTIATNHAYQGARRSLSVIDSGYWLGVLLIQGAIIGYFGTR